MYALTKIFEFAGTPLRTVLVDNEPWFVAGDICKAVGLSNTTMALRALDEDEKGLKPIETPGGIQQLNAVNESGMYALIVRSDKPNAKPFRKWVTSVVLPAIRKTGRFAIEADVNTPALPQTFAQALRLAADLQDENDAQRAQLEADAPKVAYVDQFLRDTDASPIRTFAKQIGMKEKDLRAELIARKVMFRTPVENRWSETKQKWVTEYRYEPSTEFMSWFKEGDHLNAPRLHNGQLRTTLYVTPAGKVGIARLLNRHQVHTLAIEGASA